jgi:hypothetical protein
VVTKTEGEREFRIRPRRPRTPRENEGFPWSSGMRTVVRYARSSRRRQKRRSSSASGVGRRQFNQRRAVRVMYPPNRTAGQWRAHGRYIVRDSAMQGGGARAFGYQDEVVAPPEALESWQKAGDPRLWKIIISPQFGERIDLNRLTRDLMRKMEKDLDTRLEWVAVPHFNTKHPHVHVAMRGIKADGSPLVLIYNSQASALFPKSANMRVTNSSIRQPPVTLLKREYICNGIRPLRKTSARAKSGIGTRWTP